MNEIKKSPLWSPVVLGMINYWSLTGMVVIDALLVSNMKKILLQVKRDARVERIRFLGSQSQCWQFSPLLWSSLPGDMRGIYSEENNNCREYFHWKYFSLHSVREKSRLCDTISWMVTYCIANACAKKLHYHFAAKDYVSVMYISCMQKNWNGMYYSIIVFYSIKT